jgi:hypothetical protein
MPPPNCIEDGDTESFQCGIGGATCVDCTTMGFLAGGLCNAGMCTNQIDPGYTYWISFRVIDETTATAWSCSGEYNPDPFVCVTATDDTGNSVNGCTNYCSSTKICMLSEQDGIARTASSDNVVSDTTIPAVEVPGTALANGTVTVKIYDYDYFNKNDLVGTGTLPPITQLSGTMQIMAGPYHTATCASMVTVQYEVAYEF